MIDMHGWVRRLEQEMNGWELGGRPDFLPENDDEGQDIEPEDASIVLQSFTRCLPLGHFLFTTLVYKLCLPFWCLPFVFTIFVHHYFCSNISYAQCLLTINFRNVIFHLLLPRFFHLLDVFTIVFYHWPMCPPLSSGCRMHGGAKDRHPRPRHVEGGEGGEDCAAGERSLTQVLHGREDGRRAQEWRQDSQGSQNCGPKKQKRSPTWEDTTKVFHVAGQHIKERKAA